MGLFKDKNKDEELISNENRLLREIISNNSNRDINPIMNFRDFQNNRNVTEEIGHTEVENITDDELYRMFSEGGLGYQISKIKPDATWKGFPEFSGTNENDIEKLKEINKMFQPVAKKADVMSNYSDYSIIYIGYDDNKNISQPVDNAKDILFFRAIGSKDVSIDSYDTDIKSENYGNPKGYRINFKINGKDKEEIIDQSRVIHICNNNYESHLKGIPELKGCYNYVRDIKKMAGGSSEIYYQNASGGWAFIYDDEYEKPDDEKFSQSLDKFFYSLKKYLSLTGFKDIKSVTKQYQSPEKQIINHLKLISVILGIPYRMLLGNESGELASSQDITSFQNKISDRQTNIIVPNYYDTLINNLSNVGIISDSNIEVSFKSNKQESEKEIAETEKLKSETLEKLLSNPEIINKIDIDNILERMGYQLK